MGIKYNHKLDDAMHNSGSLVLPYRENVYQHLKTRQQFSNDWKRAQICAKFKHTIYDLWILKSALLVTVTSTGAPLHAYLVATFELATTFPILDLFRSINRGLSIYMAQY